MTPLKEPPMSLDDQIAAYEEMKCALESDCFGMWVVFHGGELIDTYETFDSAAHDAVRKFRRGPYLVRQVGAPPARLPLYPRWLRHSTHAAQSVVKTR